MNAKRSTIIILIISLLNLGCSYASHIGLTYHTDRPVMLGKVQKINGAPIEPGIKKVDFDISHYSAGTELGIACWEGGCLVDKLWVSHDSADADEELKKNIVAPDNLIKVDTVYFRSDFIVIITILLINIYTLDSTTGIQGSVYEGKGTKEIENIVHTSRASGEKP